MLDLVPELPIPARNPAARNSGVRTTWGESCGIFGVFSTAQPVASLTYYGLFALQHRGQEAAGMAVSDGEQITVVKDVGLVAKVFDERSLAPLSGHLAIGHVRYATTGAGSWQNAQPVYRESGHVGFALAHNGNLTNTNALARELGMLPGFDRDGLNSDSDLVAEMVGIAMANRLKQSAEVDHDELLIEAIQTVLPTLQGAFSLVFMDHARLIAVRDRHGFRPLVLGRLDDGWVVASETAALSIVDAVFVREIEPGEIVTIDADGLRSSRWSEPDPRLCVFEFVYFARPDSALYGQNVHAARQRMGEELARQAPVDAHMVMPVPESGIPAAQGFARVSGVPYGDGLVKNRYVGRTFIQPTDRQRRLGVRLKLNPIAENLVGKRVVVIDDSIVRGTTTRQIVSLLREAGATEVHLRISSPPYRWPCFYGMDTGHRTELIAADLSVSEICQYLGADSLAYLDLDRLLTATGAPSASFCTACLSGDYPSPVGALDETMHTAGIATVGAGVASAEPHPVPAATAVRRPTG